MVLGGGRGIFIYISLFMYVCLYSNAEWPQVAQLDVCMYQLHAYSVFLYTYIFIYTYIYMCMYTVIYIYIDKYM